MTKKAICIGINDYPQNDSDLKGCVNDATAWSQLLVEHYGFEKTNVRLIHNSEATKSTIMAALTDLVENAAKGDILVFCNSSHGTYLKDTSGDEDAYDEAICPYDCEENLIIDDELRELFGKLADGASLTVISDSCHSGSVTRYIQPGKYRKAKFLNPALIGKSTLKNPKAATVKCKTKHTQAKMKDVLLSGSEDKQYSYDAEIGGEFHGAMTYYTLKAIKDANYKITYLDLHKRVKKLIKEADYPQTPQLEGKMANKKKLIFT